MKKSLFLIFLITVISFNILSFFSSAANGVIVAVAEEENGKSLSDLDEGDVVRVTVLLPKVDNTNKLQIDLAFNDSVFEYNGDADASAVLSLLTIGKIETVETNIIRLVATGLSSASFAPETVALSASFTVKQDVAPGDKNAFSLGGLKCSDESVTVMTAPIKISIPWKETTVPEVTTEEETTFVPDVTTAEDIKSHPEVTIDTGTNAVTDAETTKQIETTFLDVTTAESDYQKTSEPVVTAPDSDITQAADEIDTVITTAEKHESMYADEVTDNDCSANDDGVPIVVPVVIVLVIICTVAVIVAFLYSKRITLPK